MRKVSVQEAAEILGVSTSTVYRRINNGLLESVKEWRRRYVLLSVPQHHEESPMKHIIWPESWSDRGSTRRFDDKMNYPETGPLVIYAQQIATFLNYPIERVLKYPMLRGPEGTKLPDWWKHGRYGSQYCQKGQAEQIVARIRFVRAMKPHAKITALSTPMVELRSRERALARLRQNSEMMLKRFLVITPGFNEEFLKRVGETDLADIGVDMGAVLRAAGIRPISLDNPERWTTDGSTVEPKKLQGLHPNDIMDALKAMQRSIDAHLCPPPEDERAMRAVTVWRAMQRNGWQHPDPALTVYQPGVDRIAMCHSPEGRYAVKRGLPDRWAIVRVFGPGAAGPLDPINGCEIETELNEDKGIYEAILDPDDVEEIRL